MPTSQNHCKVKLLQICKAVEFFLEWNADANQDDYFATNSSEECNVSGMMAASAKADVREMLGPDSSGKKSRGKNVLLVLFRGFEKEAEYGSSPEAALESAWRRYTQR